jgi:hypothetical protein
MWADAEYTNELRMDSSACLFGLVSDLTEVCGIENITTNICLGYQSSQTMFTQFQLKVS